MSIGELWIIGRCVIGGPLIGGMSIFCPWLQFLLPVSFQAQSAPLFLIEATRLISSSEQVLNEP